MRFFAVYLPPAYSVARLRHVEAQRTPGRGGHVFCMPPCCALGGGTPSLGWEPRRIHWVLLNSPMLWLGAAVQDGAHWITASETGEEALRFCEPRPPVPVAATDEAAGAAAVHARLGRCWGALAASDLGAAAAGKAVAAAPALGNVRWGPLRPKARQQAAAATRPGAGGVSCVLRSRFPRGGTSRPRPRRCCAWSRRRTTAAHAAAMFAVAEGRGSGGAGLAADPLPILGPLVLRRVGRGRGGGGRLLVWLRSPPVAPPAARPEGAPPGGSAAHLAEVSSFGRGLVRPAWRRRLGRQGWGVPRASPVPGLPELTAEALRELAVSVPVRGGARGRAGGGAVTARHGPTTGERWRLSHS